MKGGAADFFFSLRAIVSTTKVPLFRLVSIFRASCSLPTSAFFPAIFDRLAMNGGGLEDAPRLLRVDLVHVDVDRMLDRFSNRVLGDFVEEDAADFLGVAAEEGHDVPADGFAFAIGV